jgi:hypothetical protein
MKASANRIAYATEGGPIAYAFQASTKPAASSPSTMLTPDISARRRPVRLPRRSSGTRSRIHELQLHDTSAVS